MDLSVNMETVKQLGLNVQEQASEYNSEIANIYSIVDDVKNNWQGADSIKYTSQVEGYKENMEALGKVIEQYGQFLLNAAQTYTQLQDDIASNASKL